MNTPPSTSRPYAPRAFTLIELLVVITIIAVLASLLLPVVQKVLENARKVTAKTTESQIVAAVNSYQTEYGQYPVYIPPGQTTPMDTTFGISGNDNLILFNVLRALNSNDTKNNTSTLNSRQIVYFESKNVKNITVPRDGFIAMGTPTGNPNASPAIALSVGDLVDPWGNMYCVRIDTNYSNAVQNPYTAMTVQGIGTNDTDIASDDTNPTSTNVIRTGVISWSWGNDGLMGSKGTTPTAPYSPTPGDDVDSWQ